MVLKVDLRALDATVKRMGAKPKGFRVGPYKKPLDPTDKELGDKGIELPPDLSGLDTSGGLLSYKGRQILLYIQDQGRNIAEVLADGQKGRKFHVADCQTLHTMRAKGKGERYVVTNRLDGEFYVAGTDWGSGAAVMEGNARLWVCQNCLKELNYKGAQQGGAYNVAKSFRIGEFFATYSSFFSHIPSRQAGNREDEGYTADWPQVAGRYKAEQDFKCESCSVELSAYKYLLHVHHRNGVKGNNTASNLQALCVSCHREQPYHNHLFIPRKHTYLINQLRREQGLLGGRPDWGKAFEYCDPGLKGLLTACRAAGIQPPELSFCVKNRSCEVVAHLDVAWPRAKLGVAISEEDSKAAKEAGWNIWTMFKALSNLNQFIEETRR